MEQNDSKCVTSVPTNFFFVLRVKYDVLFSSLQPLNDVVSQKQLLLASEASYEEQMTHGF